MPGVAFRTHIKIDDGAFSEVRAPAKCCGSSLGILVQNKHFCLYTGPGNPQRHQKPRRPLVLHEKRSLILVSECQLTVKTAEQLEWLAAEILHASGLFRLVFGVRHTTS